MFYVLPREGGHIGFGADPIGISVGVDFDQTCTVGGQKEMIRVW